MASTAKFSYQRLHKHDETSNLFDKIQDFYIRRLRRRRSFHVRRKLRVKIPSLKRFLRRKAKPVKVACSKVYRRLKEGRSHFGELFAGNYLFMQVTPTPLKYSSSSGNGIGSYNSNKTNVVKDMYFPSSSRYCVNS